MIAASSWNPSFDASTYRDSTGRKAEFLSRGGRWDESGTLRQAARPRAFSGTRGVANGKRSALDSRDAWGEEFRPQPGHGLQAPRRDFCGCGCSCHTGAANLQTEKSLASSARNAGAVGSYGGAPGAGAGAGGQISYAFQDSRSRQAQVALQGSEASQWRSGGTYGKDQGAVAGYGAPATGQMSCGGQDAWSYQAAMTAQGNEANQWRSGGPYSKSAIAGCGAPGSAAGQIGYAPPPPQDPWSYQATLAAQGAPVWQQWFKYWSDWIPSAQGQDWCIRKRWEARTLVEWMVQRWGLQTLRSGEGVLEVGGDPGFLATELLSLDVPVTVVDPAFGASGKANQWADSQTLHGLGRHAQLRVVRECFDINFMRNELYSNFLRGVSALVALYPDEATDSIMRFSASKNLRTALIPCPECVRFFPPQDPTYRGFVHRLISDDRRQALMSGASPIWEDRLYGAPYCQVLLQRSPALTASHYYTSSNYQAGQAKLSSNYQVGQAEQATPSVPYNGRW